MILVFLSPLKTGWTKKLDTQIRILGKFEEVPGSQSATDGMDREIGRAQVAQMSHPPRTVRFLIAK